MQLRAVLGRVAEQHADALVRPAPTTLVGRTPDDLLLAAGPEVISVCRELRRSAVPGGLQPGEALHTPAGALPAQWLVHVAVPAFSVHVDRSYLIGRAYRSCLQEADELGAATVALAPLGSTVRYWPFDEVIRLCLGTLRGSLTAVRETRLVLSSPTAFERFAEALARR